MKSAFKRFAMDEDGTTSIEYGLIVALIATAIIAAVTQIGSDMGTLFGDIATAMGAVVVN